MKIKPFYVYGILVIGVVLFLIISSNNRGDKKDVVQNSGMPRDEVHKKLEVPDQSSPSGSNVNEAVKHQLVMLKKAADENPGDTLKGREYADFVAAAHNPDEAIKYYNIILKKYPGRTDILFSLSFIYYNKQDLVEAEKITQKIITIDKKNSQAFYNLGALEASKGDKLKAKEIWNKLIKDFPNSSASDLARESLQKL